MVSHMQAMRTLKKKKRIYVQPNTCSQHGARVRRTLCSRVQNVENIYVRFNLRIATYNFNFVTELCKECASDLCQSFVKLVAPRPRHFVVEAVSIFRCRAPKFLNGHPEHLLNPTTLFN